MSTPFPILKTNRLLLRQFVESDLDNVFTGLSHPDVIKHYGVRYETKEATKGQLTWFADLEKNKTGLWWAICSPDDQIFYGAIGFNEWEYEHRRAELGFWLLPDYWKKGMVNEASKSVFKYAFEQMELHRIEAYVDTENNNSSKALKKLGFSFEGKMRDYEIKDGEFTSWDVFSLLKTDVVDG